GGRGRGDHRVGGGEGGHRVVDEGGHRAVVVAGDEQLGCPGEVRGPGGELTGGDPARGRRRVGRRRRAGARRRRGVVVVRLGLLIVHSRGLLATVVAGFAR